MDRIGTKNYFIVKAALCFLAAFFILTKDSVASIASSRNYKLYTGVADGGGASGTSKSYNADNSVGSPLGTAVATGTSYKIYGGMLATRNTIPDASIISFNDGLITTDDTPTLEWAFSDKDQDRQRYYQVQVSKNNFITMITDSGLVASNSTSYTTPILPSDEADVSYRWRVRVSDGYDYSGWKVAAQGFRLTTSAVEVPVIWAKTSLSGENIPGKLWQDCGAPYMYWEYPVEGLKPIGYSYAWGELPDNEADTVAMSYQTPSDLLADGVRVFNLKAENSAGNWGEVASFEIWIDRQSPIIGDYSPNKGTIISMDTPTISISATDELSGVNPASINMKINKATVNATYDQAAQNVVYVPSIPLSEGDNVVSLELVDVVGNKTSTLVWSFTVDTKGPTGYIVINNEDAMTNSVYVNLTIDAKDATSNVQSMVISNDGVFDNEQWEPFKSKKEDWMLTPISGTRKVYIKFKDTAGNESEIFSDTIELIIIAPDTIITSGPSLLTKARDAMFTFRATADDCVFRWKFDDEEWTDWSKDTFVAKKGLKDGNHYFKVQAAKDVNKNAKIDVDEMDPSPAERTWAISEKGAIKPEPEKKKPFKFWKEE